MVRLHPWLDLRIMQVAPCTHVISPRDLSRKRRSFSFRLSYNSFDIHRVTWLYVKTPCSDGKFYEDASLSSLLQRCELEAFR